MAGGHPNRNRGNKAHRLARALSKEITYLPAVPVQLPCDRIPPVCHP
jgi:hypothetical protein